MNALKNGDCVYLADLRFEYNNKGKVPTVTVYDASGNHNKLDTFIAPWLTTHRDLQVDAAWWVYDNNPSAL